MNAMSLTPAEEEVEVDVTWEDQQKICEFARLNRLKTEIEEDVQAIKDKLQGLEDAEQDVEEAFLGDEEEGLVKLALGTTFVNVDEETAEEYVASLRKKYKAEHEQLEKKKAETLESMEGLKKALYARFGGSINLEAQSH